MWSDLVRNTEPPAHESEALSTAPREVRYWCVMSIVVPKKIFPIVL